MIIRGATENDVAAVKKLWNAMIRDTTATFTTEQKTDAVVRGLLGERPGAFLIAQVDTALAGFVTWGPFRTGPGYARTAEHTIVVALPGQGTGAALMQAAFAAASAQEIHTLVAAISGENARAVSFHARLGFANAGVLREVGHKQDRWLDLVLMTRRLDPD